MRQFMMVLAVVAVTVQLSAAQQADVKLYVFAAAGEGGFVDEASKARTDSAEDLKRYLKGRRGIELVTSQEEAQVVVEVLRRVEGTSGFQTGPVDGVTGAARSAPIGSQGLELRLTVPGSAYKTEFQAGLNGKSAWRRIAQEAGIRIERWVRDNGAKLTQKK